MPKELDCIRAVTGLFGKSPSVRAFFESLPERLRKCMGRPDRALAFASLGERFFGAEDPGHGAFRADVVVSGEIRARIGVGYDDPSIEVRPEERSMVEAAAALLGELLRMSDLVEAGASQREELETLRLRMKTVFAGIPDMVAIVDADRKVIQANLAGVEAGDACHKAFFGSDEPCADCLLPRLLREKAPVSLEVEHENSRHELHAYPILNKAAEVEGFFELCRDVTFRKSFEQQLQQADRMASLGQMVLGIGHEINNPNQFIRGNVKIIKQALEDILPIVDAHAANHPELKIANLKYDFFREHILVLVGDMSNGSERIKKIVDAIKSFAREDVGTLTDEVDVNTVITESARLIYHQFRKTADVELILTPGLPTFRGNAQKIGQVIINLLINAGQAMPDLRKGIIRVTTNADNDGFVEVKVADDGVGMPDGVLKYIFDPFFTTKLTRGGTGLGLSIANRIMELHKGSISVESKPGLGTTFTLRFPVDVKDGGDTPY